MTEGQGAAAAPPDRPDDNIDIRLDDPLVRDWFNKHLPELRRGAYGQRLLYQSLAVAVIVGLAAHIAGYLLKSNATTEPLGLLADLLYALGYALWTGVVVVVFTHIFPEIKRRQFKQALDLYEAEMGEKASEKEEGPPTRGA